jgi:hypothetical protein
MNRRSDIERTLQLWMADGPSAIPDRVVDVVATRIGVQPQRRAWPFPGRTTVTQLKLAAALAAVVIVAVVGYNLLPKQPSVGGPSPVPSPTATAAPTPTAVGIQDVSSAGQRLDPGQWRFQPIGDFPSLSVVADIPAGWLSLEGQRGVENVIATNSAPSGIAIFFERPAHGMFSDPCHWDLDGSGRWDQDGDVVIGSTIAELVGALRANTSFTSSAPSRVEFGGAAGEQLELTFPADLDPDTCDRDPTNDGGRYRVMPDTIYSQGKANIWRMFVVIVGAEITNRIVVIIEYFPGTAPDKLAQAQAIVESMTFTP